MREFILNEINDASRAGKANGRRSWGLNNSGGR